MKPYEVVVANNFIQQRNAIEYALEKFGDKPANIVLPGGGLVSISLTDPLFRDFLLTYKAALVGQLEELGVSLDSTTKEPPYAADYPLYSILAAIGKRHKIPGNRF